MIQHTSRWTIGDAKISLEAVLYFRNELGLVSHGGSLPRGTPLRQESLLGILAFECERIASKSVGLRELTN